MKVYLLQMEQPCSMSDIERWLPLIGGDKLLRIQRAIRPEIAERILISDLLARYVLMEEWGLRPDQVTFGKNHYGKPLLLSHPDLHYNLSHSGPWFVCAVDSTPVGVDIEAVRDLDVGQVARFFSEEEQGALAGILQPDRRLDYLFELWTCKESYIKAVGRGLTIPLRSFTVRILENGEALLDSDPGLEERGAYYLRRYSCAEAVKLAVCSRHPGFPDTIKRLDENLVWSRLERLLPDN